MTTALRHSDAPLHDEDLAYLARQRELFHATPCLSGAEEPTERAIAEELVRLGVRAEDVSGHPGVVAVVRGPGPAMLTVRTAIDGLAVPERTGLPFRSRVPGVMHACGHDGGIAVLLTLARVLGRRGSRRGSVRLVFQPAEETLTGARLMLERGALALGPADAVCSFHLTPSLPDGHVGLAAPIAMAGAEQLVVEVHGGGGHTSAPHRGGDALAAAAEFVSRVPAVLRRAVDPREPVALGIGRAEAGTAPNVLAQRARLEGTARYLLRDAMDAVRDGVAAELGAIAASWRVAAEAHWTEQCPPVHNDPALAELLHATARNALGAAKVARVPPSLAADDVALLHERARGVYWLVGCGGGGALHTSTFDHGAGALVAALRVLDRFVERYLEAA
jgi:hippurate hydrolase